MYSHILIWKYTKFINFHSSSTYEEPDSEYAKEIN